MAKKSAQLFVGQAQPPASRNVPRAVTEIQLRALQMLFDIVMVFHYAGLEREGGPKDGVRLFPPRLTLPGPLLSANTP